MTLNEIAAALGAEVQGDGSIEIDRLAPIETAGPRELTFLANPRYRPHLAGCRAAAVILGLAEDAIPLPSLRCADPYFAFSRAIRLFYVPPSFPAGVHPSAVIAPTAVIAADARIGPHCVIGDGTRIGARAQLDAHVVVYPEVSIGDDFRAYAHVTVRESVRIGDRVTLQPGCVIGGDGFGYVASPAGGIEKIIQAGTVVLEDDVEIGANTTIDRAAVGETRIGRAAKIDNLVMVAHGCSVGEGSMLAAQVGMAGSTRIGRYVRMGGQVGTAGHLQVGDGAEVAGRSGITTDVEAGAVIGGFPATPISAWRRVTAAIPRLPELIRRVRRLEKQLEGSPDQG